MLLNEMATEPPAGRMSALVVLRGQVATHPTWQAQRRRWSFVLAVNDNRFYVTAPAGWVLVRGDWLAIICTVATPRGSGTARFDAISKVKGGDHDS